MKKQGFIVVIDDDEDVLVTARMILRSHFEKVQVESSPKKLESLLKTADVDVVILDMNFKTGATSGNEGLFWLRRIKEIDADVHVIMNTAYGDIQLAVECMKDGATDFLVKPWEQEKLLSTVKNVLALKQSKKEITRLEEASKTLARDLERSHGDLIGSSPAMQQVFDSIDKVARTDANVLVLGENGTGKELVARAIHNASKRSRKPFVKVDLGSLTDSLFESEMFGHKKGAFTDAKEDRVGRFEVANGGTMFLDEIGNIPMTLQSKLLSVLQNRQVSKVGDHRVISLDIRLVCATNKDIYGMVQEEQFREDLLYRVNTIEIELPRLADREGDIGLLTKHFMHVYGNKYEKPGLKLSKDTQKKLESYPWPGNVRELQHAVERAVIMSSSDTLEPEDFLVKKSNNSVPNTKSLNVEEVEKQTIIEALEKYNGNLTQAAKELGMGRSTLYRKLTRYRI